MEILITIIGAILFLAGAYIFGVGLKFGFTRHFRWLALIPVGVIFAGFGASIW